MALNIVIFIIAVLIVAIWIIYGLKRIRHKFLAIFLIALVLFSFLSFGFVFNGKDIPMNNFSDFGNVVKLYFSWLGSVFVNIKSMTADAVKMDWQGNKTT
jgi:glucan phosphoethanolaminetransferase (alkaline phosphatase superfamily)